MALQVVSGGIWRGQPPSFLTLVCLTVKLYPGLPNHVHTVSGETGQQGLMKGGEGPSFYSSRVLVGSGGQQLHLEASLQQALLWWAGLGYTSTPTCE